MLEFLLSVTALAHAEGTAWWVTSSLEKVQLQDLPPATPVRVATVATQRGEIEAFQLHVALPDASVCYGR